MSPTALTTKSLDISKLLANVAPLKVSDDWVDWKNYMERMLDQMGFWEPFIVLGKKLSPNSFISVLDSIDVRTALQFNDRVDEDTYVTRVNIYKEAAKSADNMIYAALSPAMRQHVRDVVRKEPYLLWSKLLSMFERETPLTNRQRLAQFLQIRMDDQEDAQTFYNRIVNAAQQLRDRKMFVDSNMIILAVYGGLTKKYEPIITVLEQNEALEVSQIVERLRDFEQRQSLRDGPKSADVFNVYTSSDVCRNFIKGRCTRGDSCHYKHINAPSTGAECKNCGRNHGQAKCLRPPRECHQCKKLGHMSRFCTDANTKVSAASVRVSMDEGENWVF